MKRSGGLRRKTPLRQVNPQRAAKRRREAFGRRAVVVRTLRCLVGAGCEGAVEAAHVRSRGAGGDRRDLIPLCSRHHREQHACGIKTFSARYGLDLQAEAARLADRMDRKGIE